MRECVQFEKSNESGEKALARALGMLTMRAC